MLSRYAVSAIRRRRSRFHARSQSPACAAGAGSHAHGTAGQRRSPRPPPTWPPISPADAGFAPDLEARLDKLIADKRAWNLHGVVVVRDGRLVLERYFEAEDNARGRDLGKVAFKPDTLHDMRSVSKGVVGLLYGIALEQGKVPAPEAPLFAVVSRVRRPGRARPGRDRLTIHHVLTMTMGTDWDESSMPYSNPANSEIAMDLAPDRFRYILERRVVMEPGKRWTYCGGATALLARIIAKGTGKPLHAFAREALFDPLGLGPTEWLADAKGEPLRRVGPAHGAPRPGPHRHDDGERRPGRRPARGAGAMARAMHRPDRERR